MTGLARPSPQETVVTAKNQKGPRPIAGWRGFLQRMTVSWRGGRLLVVTCLMVSFGTFNYSIKFEQLQAQFEFRKLTLSSVGSISLQIGNSAQVKWSGKTGQRAKMYPTLKTGYTNDQETQLFRQI